MSKLFIILFTASILLSFYGHGSLATAVLAEDECPPGTLEPFLVICKNGTILRDTKTVAMHKVPPSLDPKTKVNSVDITISTPPHVSTQLNARVYFPKLRRQDQKLPILVYFHGGGFCIGSSADTAEHAYHNRVSSKGPVLVISVDYRLFPEHTIPTPYEDSWSALKWVASLGNPTSTTTTTTDFASVTSGTPTAVDTARRISLLGNFSRVFIGGDSAGANIAHNLAIRAGFEPLPNNLQLAGAFLAMPYFLGSVPVPLEPSDFKDSAFYKLWDYVCPKSECAGLGVDDPRINPMGPGAPSLAGLNCGRRLMVYVAEQDKLLGRGRWYVDLVRSSGWEGDVILHEAIGEGHVFQVFNPKSREAGRLVRRLSAFIYSN